ncbi:transposable element Tcb1 transposase [Trichonephila clavipes]|nr:transposable element Tcb1 transposase [Trichonephila clavipes]
MVLREVGGNRDTDLGFLEFKQKLLSCKAYLEDEKFIYDFLDTTIEDRMKEETRRKRKVEHGMKMEKLVATDGNSPLPLALLVEANSDGDDGNVSRCYCTRRPRVTTPNEDRYLAVTAKRNRQSTASDLSHQLSSATGTTVSRQTVYRRLGRIGLYACRHVRCVPLISTHCRLRLTWSREHTMWTPQQLSCVVFSDKFRFSLQSDSRWTLIWRAPSTHYHQENTIERNRFCGLGWLVWGGSILGSRTGLHVQSVTMTGHMYRDVILEQHVRLFRGAIGAEFLFMDDNARPHRANIVDECFQSEDITRMDWPAYSPDLNPVEHVEDMLGRRIAVHQPPSTVTSEDIA